MLDVFYLTELAIETLYKYLMLSHGPLDIVQVRRKSPATVWQGLLFWTKPNVPSRYDT